MSSNNLQRGFVSLVFIAFVLVICAALFAGYKLLGAKDEYDGMRQQTTEYMDAES